MNDIEDHFLSEREPWAHGERWPVRAVQQPGRASVHAVLEQWQPFPNVTGPETVQDLGMWMASRAATVFLPTTQGTGAPQ